MDIKHCCKKTVTFELFDQILVKCINTGPELLRINVIEILNARSHSKGAFLHEWFKQSHGASVVLHLSLVCEEKVLMLIKSGNSGIRRSKEYGVFFMKPSTI